MKIHNPNNLPLIDYRKIKPLQGDLKDLSDTNYRKLKKSLLEHGYTFPGFVWKDGEDYYAIDMHQRLRVMNNEDMNDNGSYDIPVVFIPADNMQDAKKKLLVATSQYGSITYEGLDQFIATAELPEAEVYQAVHFDALPLLGQEVKDKEPEPDLKPPKLSIEILFDTKDELENCLAEIQPICEGYEIKGIQVHDGEKE